jgi:signal transduction histidine kinase
VTLAQRLLVAIGVLTITTTATLGLGVREAWRSAEEERFRSQFRLATLRLEGELDAQIRTLPELVGRLCKHDPMIDSALVGLRGGDLDERRMSLALRTPELMRGLGLDELLLVTSRGDVLGAGHAEGLAGRRDPTLVERTLSATSQARLRTAERPLAVEAACIRRHTADPRIWVGLFAARHLEPLLDSIAQAHRLELSVGAREPARDRMTETVRLGALGGVRLTASQSRMPLLAALRQLDTTVLAIGAGTFAAALLVAILLSRGLARPIVALSRQAREVVAGEPKPVEPGGGGREIEELTQTFNKAIADLTALRKRLAATERIAARREIARRVAHEIKNPLAPIRAAIETLRRLRARGDPAFDEYFDEATRTVLEEVARITSIVSEFTRFARLPPPNPAPMDIVETVRSVVGLHAGSGPRIELSVANCPPLSADRDQMVQVMTNLLQNALDACSGVEGARVVVEVHSVDGERVMLSVRDNGPGVDREIRDRLFEPYATTKAEGTGLGLAIVERIVVEHGGEIRLRDPPGGGAEFVVTLPLAGPQLLPEAPASVPSSA